jgi:GntR family carbon starvation induced transcriptional regulator
MRNLESQGRTLRAATIPVAAMPPGAPVFPDARVLAGSKPLNGGPPEAFIFILEASHEFSGASNLNIDFPFTSHIVDHKIETYPQETLVRAAQLKPAASLTSSICKAVREDIISGHLAPGAKIKPAEISDLYGCALTTVREALSRLAAEGLVTMEDQRGFRIAPVSRSDLVDLTQTRIEIECTALRMAIAKGDADWESAVVGSCHRLCREPFSQDASSRPSQSWIALHQAFHINLLNGCGSPRLLEICGRLYQQADRYRYLSMRMPARNVDKEHEAIAAATVRRDAPAATSMLTEHYLSTTSIIIELAESGGFELVK